MSIDLSKLPPPDVVETLEYEDILAALVADYRTRYPEFSAWVESEPALKLFEVAAYREILLRQRVNDAARSSMIAFARGATLEHLAALTGVSRATDESDDALLRRILVSADTGPAGSVGAYRWHARAADPAVIDAHVATPTPGAVTVSILARGGASNALVTKVGNALSAKEVRPLTDVVTVTAATELAFNVVATLEIGSGPDAATVTAAAEAAVRALAADRYRLGASVPANAIVAALFVPGVEDVALTTPAADVDAAVTQAPSLGTVTLSTTIAS